jgi:hypothetical protein
LYNILQGLSLKIASFLQLCRTVSRQPNHPCAWGPLVVVLVISIKLRMLIDVSDVLHVLDVRVHVLDVRVRVRRVRRACLAVSKLFIY